MHLIFELFANLKKARASVLPHPYLHLNPRFFHHVCVKCFHLLQLGFQVGHSNLTLLGRLLQILVLLLLLESFHILMERIMVTRRALFGYLSYASFRLVFGPCHELHLVF